MTTKDELIRLTRQEIRELEGALRNARTFLKGISPERKEKKQKKHKPQKTAKRLDLKEVQQK